MEERIFEHPKRCLPPSAYQARQNALLGRSTREGSRGLTSSFARQELAFRPKDLKPIPSRVRISAALRRTQGGGLNARLASSLPTKTRSLNSHRGLRLTARVTHVQR